MLDVWGVIWNKGIRLIALFVIVYEIKVYFSFDSEEGEGGEYVSIDYLHHLIN